jgi:predicted transcriptional regulator
MNKPTPTPTPKQAALAAIGALPDETSFEEIVYRLHVLEAIEAGNAEIEAGEGIPHEEMKAEIARWLHG